MDTTFEKCVARTPRLMLEMDLAKFSICNVLRTNYVLQTMEGTRDTAMLVSLIPCIICQ